MLPEIEKLLILQDKDQRIAALKNELKNLPALRAHHDKLLQEAQQRFEAAKTRSREIEVERKSLETEAQAKRDQVARYRQQQLQTRKNEEYSALAHEIEVAEKAIASIEDRELELMEEAEALKPKLAEAEKVFNDEKNQIAEKKVQLDAREVAIKKQLEDVQAERTALARDLDEDIVDKYERIFRSKGDAAVTALEHGVCMGCHMKVTTQTALAVKAEKQIIQCPQCGRILYFSE